MLPSLVAGSGTDRFAEGTESVVNSFIMDFLLPVDDTNLRRKLRVITTYFLAASGSFRCFLELGIAFVGFFSIMTILA